MGDSGRKDPNEIHPRPVPWRRSPALEESPEEILRSRIVALRSVGKSPRDIALELGMTVAAVERAIRRDEADQHETDASASQSTAISANDRVAPIPEPAVEESSRSSETRTQEKTEPVPEPQPTSSDTLFATVFYFALAAIGGIMIWLAALLPHSLAWLNSWVTTGGYLLIAPLTVFIAIGIVGGFFKYVLNPLVTPLIDWIANRPVVLRWRLTRVRQSIAKHEKYLEDVHPGNRLVMLGLQWDRETEAELVDRLGGRTSAPARAGAIVAPSGKGPNEIQTRRPQLKWRRLVLSIIGALLVLRVMFPVEQCRGRAMALLPASVWTDSAGAPATLAAGVAYLERIRESIDRDLAVEGTPSSMSLLNGESAIQYAFDRQWPPAWLDPIYARAKAAALQNLRTSFEQNLPRGLLPLPTWARPLYVPSGQVVEAVDKALQGATDEVRGMKPVPWWQRLRMTWTGNQCPPSVGITALQALLLVGAFWYVSSQWK